MIAALIRSFRKSNELKRISKLMAKPIDRSNMSAMLAQMGQKDKLENELVALCLKDEGIRLVLDKHGADEADLKAIRDRLSLHGAGQWAGGHLVSASSIAYAAPLDYLLDIYKGPYGAEKEIWDSAAYRLVEYFERGETGEV
ncbi:hypothetical protein EJV47_00325 [Hymenobacter gummosus]|uniref:Uncharacterized protein n=1 Tax=Hymenobacter gummosus TaxID=1776032 RepID=A0A431U7I1_9BACT|nr:hypothetical protein [Hymenobacter gummosus]RTQ53224.1 hypothetical protein EJV47_00325 [Hymenobacter gummosus]